MPRHPSSAAETLLNATRRFTRAGFSQSQTMLTGELSRADWHLMWLLQRGFAGEGARPSELAKRLRVTAGNVAQQLRSLESKQLIARTQDNEDRRAVMIKLTALGEIKLEEVKKEYVSEFERLTTHLGAEDTTQLIRLLTTAAAFLETTEDPSC
jgi:DNA-binding MarR family transcriptional regulator